MTTDDDPGTRTTKARILRAASEIARDGSGTKITVRAVAQRAGVGIGTLRHHFPTQRELLDAVLASIYEEALPDERIRDTSVPADDRLRTCLHQVLEQVGVGDRAREVWTELFRTFIAPDASPEARTGYLELSRSVHRRIESWLCILVDEGALAAGDNAARARHLLTVVNGLAVQRALPSDEAPLDLETAVLRLEVDRLLAERGW